MCVYMCVRMCICVHVSVMCHTVLGDQKAVDKYLVLGFISSVQLANWACSSQIRHKSR